MSDYVLHSRCRTEFNFFQTQQFLCFTAILQCNKRTQISQLWRLRAEEAAVYMSRNVSWNSPSSSWYILGKKCARYSGSIALATHAPQRVQFIIDGCRESLRVILLHEFSKRLKLCTILDLESYFYPRAIPTKTIFPSSWKVLWLARASEILCKK